MLETDRKAHWEDVYATRGQAGVSWYQAEPGLSLELIRAVAPSAGGRIIDVGGGASLLVDRLLDLPFERIAVLDMRQPPWPRPEGGWAIGLSMSHGLRPT